MIGMTEKSPVHIFPHVLSISEPFKGILLDAYGVFWNGNSLGLLPGSKETMEKLVSNGKIVGILSNSTQLAAKETRKLQKHGLIEGQHFHFLTTSGEVAKQIFCHERLPFATPKKKFWLFGGIHPKFSSHQDLFNNTLYTETPHIQEADFIYISIPHIDGEDQTDPELFREQVYKLKNSGLPMVCTNPDRFAHEGQPLQAVVRQGCIASMYEECGGQVIYIGKPSNLVYEAAMQYFVKQNIVTPEQVLMVGDTPETDIRGAGHFGMSSALVTQTGMMADRISQRGLENVLQDFPQHDFPNFFIERLGHHEL
jgi:HAD superfamily hydrolase (TIGR01459 family)